MKPQKGNGAWEMKVKLLDVEKHLQLDISGHEQVNQALPVSLGKKGLHLRILGDHRRQGHRLRPFLIEFLQKALVVMEKGLLLFSNDVFLLGGQADVSQRAGAYEGKEKKRDEELPFQT